jgi:hypothetical protein
MASNGQQGQRSPHNQFPLFGNTVGQTNLALFLTTKPSSLCLVLKTHFVQMGWQLEGGGTKTKPNFFQNFQAPHA